MRIKEEKRWILWKPVPKDNGKIDKIPKNPKTGNNMSVTDFTKAVTYREAVDAAEHHDLKIGVLLGEGLACIDLDHCIGVDGTKEEADNIIVDIDSYTEFSPSGTGVHIFYYGKKPGDRCRTKVGDFEIEIYEKERFMTFTGNELYGEEVMDRQEQIERLYNTYFPLREESVERERGTCENPSYKLKYALAHDKLLAKFWEGTRDDEDESRNDLAIIGKLCYWLDRDPVTIYDVLLKSPYFESKSDKHKKKFESRYEGYFIPTFEKANNAMTEAAWDWKKMQIITSGESFTDTMGSTIDMKDFEKANEDLLVDDGEEDYKLPVWLHINPETGTSKIKENLFATWFVNKFHLLCINSVFYTENGEIPNNYLTHKIQDYIEPYVDSSLAGKAKKLLEAVANKAYKQLPRPHTNEVHVQGSTLYVDGRGVKDQDPKFTINRLNVNHDTSADCPTWLKFLDELIEPEYVPILQEYMGYCLSPTTMAQAACFIIGNGGEGKSLIPQVMQKIFGKSQLTGQIHKLSANNFMLSNLENKLCFLDDDINLAALDDTSTFKQLVTNNGHMLIERKNIQAYSGQIYAKVLACGNGSLRSKYDKSDGFYRRLLIIKCKAKDPDRVDDKMLHVKILKETDGIFQWMLEGLVRLMSNGWYFSKSQKIENNIEALKDEADNVRLYLKDEDYVKISKIQELSATTNEIYDGYTLWCHENGFDPMSMRRMSNFLKQHQEQLNIEYTGNIKRNGVRKRGYCNMQIKRNTSNLSGNFTQIVTNYGKKG